jgi:hypothetical protein
MSVVCETTRALATKAYEASGCTKPEDFVALFGKDVIGSRSFRYWLNGERPASPLAQLVLREFIAGWRPKL